MLDKETKERVERGDDALRAKGWTVVVHTTPSGDRVSYNKPPYDTERQEILDIINTKGASNVDYDWIRKVSQKYQARNGMVRRGKNR